MKLKLHKVDEIKTARSELEMYGLRREMEEFDASDKEFFRTHSRVFKGEKYSQEKTKEIDSNQLSVFPRKV